MFQLACLVFLLVPMGAWADDDFEVLPPYECSPLGDSPRTELPALCVYPRGLGLPQVLTDSYCEPVALTDLDLASARAWFERLAAEPGIPFRFLPESCQARAQKMAQILLGAGVRNGKIFIKGQFAFTSPHDPLWPVRWAYHVASVVSIRLPSGARELMVIDPSLFSDLVPLAEFVAKFREFPVSRIDEVYFTGPFTYEMNHRPLRLADFRERDLYCMQEMLRTGMQLQDLLEKK